VLTVLEIREELGVLHLPRELHFIDDFSPTCRCDGHLLRTRSLFSLRQRQIGGARPPGVEWAELEPVSGIITAPAYRSHISASGDDSRVHCSLPLGRP
jgi:hypothetical protein